MSPSSRRYRIAPTLGAAAVLLAGCASSEIAGPGEPDHSGAVAVVEGPEDSYAGIDLPEPYQRASFTLTDTAGQSYDFGARTAGRPTLLFFGFTRCPDICPATLADVTVALRQVAPAVAEQVQMVFVTTDPAHDTPEVMGEYLSHFDADLPKPFVGLTGTQEAIEQAQLSAESGWPDTVGRNTRRSCCCTAPTTRPTSPSTPETPPRTLPPPSRRS